MAELELANPACLRALLARHGFHFSKALGQNFLIDPAVCPRMAQMCGADKAAGVLEIGPGVGVLTVALARAAQKVLALELDARLLPVLKETLAGCENVRVVQADAMEADLAGLIEKHFGGRAAVCANLPYYITSPLLMRLLEERLPITSITVMVQKEAGQRICAAPGSREAGALTLAVWYRAAPRILFEVPAGSFLPAPKVDSVVIRLDVREAPAVAVRDETLFFAAIRAAFAQRRKMLRAALPAGLGIPRARTAAALAAAGIDPTLRGERLTLADFARLADALAEV